MLRYCMNIWIKSFLLFCLTSTSCTPIENFCIDLADNLKLDYKDGKYRIIQSIKFLSEMIDMNNEMIREECVTEIIYDVDIPSDNGNKQALLDLEEHANCKWWDFFDWQKTKIIGNYQALDYIKLRLLVAPYGGSPEKILGSNGSDFIDRHGRNILNNTGEIIIIFDNGFCYGLCRFTENVQNQILLNFDIDDKIRFHIDSSLFYGYEEIIGLFDLFTKNMKSFFDNLFWDRISQQFILTQRELQRLRDSSLTMSISNKINAVKQYLLEQELEILAEVLSLDLNFFTQNYKTNKMHNDAVIRLAIALLEFSKKSEFEELLKIYLSKEYFALVKEVRNKSSELLKPSALPISKEELYKFISQRQSNTYEYHKIKYVLFLILYLFPAKALMIEHHNYISVLFGGGIITYLQSNIKRDKKMIDFDIQNNGMSLPTARCYYSQLIRTFNRMQVISLLIFFTIFLFHFFLLINLKIVKIIIFTIFILYFVMLCTGKLNLTSNIHMGKIYYLYNRDSEHPILMNDVLHVCLIITVFLTVPCSLYIQTKILSIFFQIYAIGLCCIFLFYLIKVNYLIKDIEFINRNSICQTVIKLLKTLNMNNN